jgi:hypothetical protein
MSDRGGQLSQRCQPGDVGQLGLRFRQIVIKTRILQRDRGLRRKQFQHCDPRRRENVGSQIIFEVEQTDQFALINQRQAENGTGKWILG